MSRASEIVEQLSWEEQRSLEEALTAVLAPPHQPEDAFVAELEEALLAEAERRQEQQSRLSTVGLVGGGIATLILGILGFILFRRQRREAEPEEAPAPAPVPAPAG